MLNQAELYELEAMIDRHGADALREAIEDIERQNCEDAQYVRTLANQGCQR